MLTTVATTATTIAFLAMVATWCGIGRLAGTHHAVVEGPEKVERWLAPTAFIGLGLYGLLSSGALAPLA